MNLFSKQASRRRTWLRMAISLGAATAWLSPAPAAAHKRESCHLFSARSGIRHVIYIQFDNVHLSRANPNVPSDLELMPHLYRFLKSNGTLLNKHYTVLISHTSGGITSSLTGLYPDRMGITESNSYDYYDTSTGQLIREGRHLLAAARTLADL